MKEGWKGVKRLLCVRLDALGDLLMTTPALRGLKEGLPGASLTLLASPQGAAIAEMIPEVDEVIVYSAPWMKATAPRADPTVDLAMVERLRRGGYDAAVIFTVQSQSPLPAALLLHLAGVRRLLAHCRENPYQLLSDWVPEPEPGEATRHEVQRQLDLVAAIGCRPGERRLSLELPADRIEAMRGRLAAAGIDGARPWVLIHPGATAPSRRYPAGQFAAAARLLAERHGWQLLFSGGPGEVELIESIRAEARVPSLSLAGRTTLQELAAAIALAPLLIVNNTGPAHIAAALGTPVVDLYALTNTQHTPWQVESRVLFHEVPCRNCLKSVCPQGHHDCLRLVGPEEVVAAALELQAGAGGAARERRTGG